MVLSMPIAMVSMAFSIAATPSPQPLRHPDVVGQAVAPDDDFTSKVTFIQALEYPTERFALLAPTVEIRETSDPAPSNAAITAIFHWSLFAVGFAMCIWWFGRLVSFVP